MGRQDFINQRKKFLINVGENHDSARAAPLMGQWLSALSGTAPSFECSGLSSYWDSSWGSTGPLLSSHTDSTWAMFWSSEATVALWSPSPMVSFHLSWLSVPPLLPGALAAQWLALKFRCISPGSYQLFLCLCCSTYSTQQKMRTK